jgi:FlaA1/EpsC-like NDP-sugar epimerase
MELEYKADRIQYAPGDEFKPDEEGHYALRHEMRLEQDVLQFAVGDVRDAERVMEVMRGVDIVFHAAALKQVPMSEFHPYEAVKTNIIGAHNVRLAAIQSCVKKVVAISTDKAVKPVNAMGMTKAIQEKIMLSSEESRSETKFACVRYGNVIGSRGSVIPRGLRPEGAGLHHL